MNNFYVYCDWNIILSIKNCECMYKSIHHQSTIWQYKKRDFVGSKLTGDRLLSVRFFQSRIRSCRKNPITISWLLQQLSKMVTVLRHKFPLILCFINNT